MPAEKGTKQITSKQMVLKILRNKPHRTQNYRLSNARSLTLTDDTQPTKYPTDHATPPLNKRTNNKKPTNRKHPACQTPIITPCQNSWITTLAKTCSAGGPKNEGQKRCRVRGRHSRPDSSGIRKGRLIQRSTPMWKMQTYLSVKRHSRIWTSNLHFRQQSPDSLSFVCC